MLPNHMRVSPRLATCLMACWLIVAVEPHCLGQTYQGKQLVKPELLADTTAVVPGKPFIVGLLLRMAPGWHTYWKFSGDAGLPTEAKWKLPAGWKISEIQWPIPLKTIDLGDIQTYGYVDEVLLMQEITPSPKQDSSSAKLSADANWFVCEKICIPGSATLQLELPVSATSQLANTELFARYRRLLPQNCPGANRASTKWERAGTDRHLKSARPTLSMYPSVVFFLVP